MTSTVRIDWSREYDNKAMWNEVCAWAMEKFGLPGDRFVAHPNVLYMDFIFKNNKDALLMALHWNARIVPNHELAVETVGRYIQ